MTTYKEIYLNEAINAPFIKNASKAIDQAIKSLSKVKSNSIGDIILDLEDTLEDLKKIK